MRLGQVEDGGDRRHPAHRRRISPSSGRSRCSPSAGGADHRHQVATEIARDAGVGRQHAHQVLPQPAGLAEPDRRDAQPLLPDFRRAGVVAAMGGAADIDLVRAHRRTRSASSPSARTGMMMVRSGGGCRRDRGRSAGRCRRRTSPAKASATALAAQGMAPTCTGIWSACATSRQSRVAERDGEVARGVEDLRVGGPQHRLPHLLDDGAEPVVEDGEGDGVRQACRPGGMGRWRGGIGHAGTVGRARRPPSSREAGIASGFRDS